MRRRAKACPAHARRAGGGGEARGALLLTIALSACGADAGSEPGGASPLVLRGATIIDGTGGSPVADGVVIVADGLVLVFGAASVGTVPVGARVEDLSGKFLVPGLIDVHAHALVPRCQAADAATGFDWEMSRRMMAAVLRSGVTTARSPASPTALGIAMRDSLAAGGFPGPRLLVAGELIDGRHTTPAQVRAEVGAQAAAGVDFVKLYAGLGDAVVRAGIAEAHARGVRVIGHLERATWGGALAAGIDHLTHVVPWNEELLPASRRATVARARDQFGPMRARIDWLEAFDPEGPEVDSLIAALVRHRVPVDPTVVAFDTKFSFDSVGERPVAARYREHAQRDAVPGLVALWESCGTPTDSWTADDFRRIRAAWPRLLRLVRRYHEGGVLLTAGSDTPNPWVIPGEGLHREMELLVEAGIPPAAVLSIATRNGADVLGLLDSLGTIEPGKRADLVLLDADPLTDIANTRRIVWVMQGGLRETIDDRR